MTISLAKGEKIVLEKVAPGLKRVRIETNWDENTSTAVGAKKHDLDTTVVLLGDDDQVIFKGPAALLWYNTDRTATGPVFTPDGAISYSGDNEDGRGKDDEKITIDFAKVSDAVRKIAIVSSIHKAKELGLNFGMVKNACVAMYNDETNERFAIFDLSEDRSTETALITGKYYRHNGEWKWETVGAGYAEGLGPILTSFGLDVTD